MLLVIWFDTGLFLALPESLNEKMTAKAIKVAVLEGEFADLCNLGLPFSTTTREGFEVA